MPALDAARDQIRQLDLGPIKVKLRESTDYSDAEIAVIEKWYRHFLFLVCKYPDKAIVVPEAVDHMWHQHILDTRKYADDCRKVFGQLLHHFPYFGLRGEEDRRALLAAFEETNHLMESEFGANAVQELGQLRPEWANEDTASSCSDCSGYWDPHSAGTSIFASRPAFVAR